MRYPVLAVLACGFTLLATSTLAVAGAHDDAVDTILAANRAAVGGKVTTGTMTRH